MCFPNPNLTYTQHLLAGLPPPKVNTGSYVATHKGTDCETVFTIFSIRLAAGLLVTITRSFVSASVKSDSFVPRTTTRQQYIDACW